MAVSTSELTHPTTQAAPDPNAGAAIGVVGGGQLAWMLADAAGQASPMVRLQRPLLETLVLEGLPPAGREYIAAARAGKGLTISIGQSVLNSKLQKDFLDL